MADDDGERANEQAKKEFEEVCMNNTKSMKEYIARAKYLATLNVWYHVIEGTG